MLSKIKKKSYYYLGAILTFLVSTINVYAQEYKETPWDNDVEILYGISPAEMEMMERKEFLHAVLYPAFIITLNYETPFYQFVSFV